MKSIEKTGPTIRSFYVIYCPEKNEYLSDFIKDPQEKYFIIHTLHSYKGSFITSTDKSALEAVLDILIDTDGTTLRVAGFKVVQIIVEEVKQYFMEDD
jgi:hypothetical protein